MTTTVVNIKDQTPTPYPWGIPDDCVYIGRPSKWGNPFAIGGVLDRAEVVQKYKEWLCSNNELYAAIGTELADKTLICWCAPLPCHGDVLAAIADGDLVLMPV